MDFQAITERLKNYQPRRHDCLDANRDHQRVFIRRRAHHWGERTKIIRTCYEGVEDVPMVYVESGEGYYERRRVRVEVDW